MIIQKICENLTGRIIFLGIIIILVDILFCYSITASLHVYLPFDAIKLMKKTCNNDESTELTTEELTKDKTYELNNIISTLEEKIENSELKFFKNFIKFKIFVENSIETQNNEIIKFNSEWIDGVYTEVNSDQGKVFLTKKNLNGLRQLKLEDLEYSFDSEKDPPIYIINDDKNIKFHIEASLISLFLWYLLISIPIAWGVILLLNFIDKFIFQGKPVIEDVRN